MRRIQAFAIIFASLWTSDSISRENFPRSTPSMMHNSEYGAAHYNGQRRTYAGSRLTAGLQEAQIQRKTGQQTPAQDRILFPMSPYKYPYWGLPYSTGIYRAPGFPPYPYDPSFGNPWAQRPQPQPQPPAPPPTKAPTTEKPHEDHEEYEYYYVRKRPKRKRKRRPHTTPAPAVDCDCSDEEEDYYSNSPDCRCKGWSWSRPVVSNKPKPRPKPGGSKRPFPRKLKKGPLSSTSGGFGWSSRPGRHCRPGYSYSPSQKGSGWTCKPLPEDPEPDPECEGKRYKGRCYYPMEGEDETEEEEEEEEEAHVIPQYIPVPVYVPVPHPAPPPLSEGWGRGQGQGQSSYEPDPVVPPNSGWSSTRNIPEDRDRISIPLKTEPQTHYPLTTLFNEGSYNPHLEPSSKEPEPPPINIHYVPQKSQLQEQPVIHYQYQGPAQPQDFQVGSHPPAKINYAPQEAQRPVYQATPDTNNFHHSSSSHNSNSNDNYNYNHNSNNYNRRPRADGGSQADDLEQSSSSLKEHVVSVPLEIYFTPSPKATSTSYKPEIRISSQGRESSSSVNVNGNDNGKRKGKAGSGSGSEFDFHGQTSIEDSSINNEGIRKSPNYKEEESQSHVLSTFHVIHKGEENGGKTLYSGESSHNLQPVVSFSASFSEDSS